MKKKLFRSLENLLDRKMVVLPFLGLLAASAVVVWTTAFAPGKKQTAEEGNAGEKKTPREGKTSPEASALPETRAEGAEVRAEPRQCKAITKKGTRCKHMADESGYCPQHRALFEEQVPLEANPNL